MAMTGILFPMLPSSAPWNRRSQGLLYRHASAKALLHSGTLDPDHAQPFGLCARHAVQGYKPGRDRAEYGVLRRPSHVKPLVDRPFHDSTAPGPLGNGQVFSANSQDTVDARVAVLCESVRPSAISGCVRTIVVNAIKAVADWAGAQVRKEDIERITPRIGHQNAAPSVVPEVVVPRVIAASLRAQPRRVLAAMFHQSVRAHSNAQFYQMEMAR